MNVVRIDSIDCTETSVYARLTEAQLRNRLEPEKGIFICESLKVVRIALENGYHPLSFLAEERNVASQVAPLFDDARYGIDPTTPVYCGSREVLRQLTGYELSRGILCAMHRPTLPSVAEVCSKARRIAVVDSVVNSTNTGAIFRAAAALGIEGILMTPTCCDPLNRRSTRVSMGTVMQLPWTYTERPWPNDTISQLHDMGFCVVALALSDRALAIDDPRLTECDRIAIVMGTEGDGLAKATIEACDQVAKIPMHRGVDSLNVAAAAAVAFWQLREKT